MPPFDPVTSDYVTEQEEKAQSVRLSRNHDKNNNNQTGASETTNLLSTASKDYNKLLDPTVATTGMDESSDEENCYSEDDDDNDSSSRVLNLNMCSAWTHICADTLRSLAVLIAAGFAYLFPNLLSLADADSWGAIVVSVIIIVSLGPLVEGLYFTAWEIYYVHKEHERRRKLKQPEEVVLQV